MASTPLTLIFLTLIPLLTPRTQAQNTTAPNIIVILEKSGQHTTFIRIIKETQQSRLKYSTNSEGFSVFAPTDDAFNNLKPGTTNNLTDEQKVQLVLYHVTPKYYTLSDLLIVNSPVKTQASRTEGSWRLNFTGQGNQVNVSTGVVTTPVNKALRQHFPLAVYQVDKVLLPLELFNSRVSTHGGEGGVGSGGSGKQLN